MEIIDNLGKTDFISPKKILQEIGLKPGDIVVDYGSGAGHWAIPAAKIVQPNGLVYALEDKIEILNMLKSRAEIQKITNIEIEEINLEKGNTKLQVDADLIIISNILHLIRDKESYLKKASSLLGESGKILVVDWKSDKSLFGPPAQLRMNEEDLMMLAEKADLHIKCTVNAGWHHFGLLFEKGEAHARSEHKSGK